jgi:hypothetical protein
MTACHSYNWPSVFVLQAFKPVIAEVRGFVTRFNFCVRLYEEGANIESKPVDKPWPIQ